MDSFFGLDRESINEEGLSLLTTLFDEISLACTESILRDAEIPYLVKRRGSGSSVKIIMGFSMFGADVYVRDEELEVAKAILQAPTEETEETEEEE